jgi:uncharacterized membrane protein
MKRCLSCNNDFDGNLCPVCGTKYSTRKSINPKPIFDSPKFKISPAILFFCFFFLAVCTNFIQSQHTKNVIGATFFFLIAITLIIFPRYFLNIWIRLFQKNYENALALSKNPPPFFKVLGLDKKALSVKSTKSGEWIIRIVGLVLIYISYETFHQEFFK